MNDRKGLSKNWNIDKIMTKKAMFWNFPLSAFPGRPERKQDQMS